MASHFKARKKIDEGGKGAVVLEGTYEYRENVALKHMEKKYIDTIEQEEMLLCTRKIYTFWYRHWKDIKDEFEKNKLKSIKELCEIGMLSNIDSNLRRIPTNQASNILRQIMEGISHIHKKHIIHKDLTPENILLKFKGNRVHVKIADFNYDNNVYGTFGWRAPQQINGNVQTDAIDTFNFGCIVFYCIIGGEHTFGNNPEERENNIKNGGHYNVSSIQHIPETLNLVNELLVHRSTIHQVKSHPFFWNSN